MAKNPNTDLIEKLDPDLNRELTNSILDARNGEKMTKLAAAGEDYIRTHIRESGFLRKILPPKPISNEELDRVVEHDRPVRFEELETNHKGAVSLPFNVTSDTEFFYGPKGQIDFHTIRTPVFTKNVNELRTYHHDIQKVVTEHQLNDIETREDAAFIDLCNLIVGTVSPTGGKSGSQQHFKAGDGTNNTSEELSGGMSKEVYVEIQKKLENFRLNNGVMLMNTKTAKEFSKYDSLAIGDTMAGKMFKEGLKGMGDAVVGGVPHVYTIKDDLVADNVIFCFTEPNYLGRFYTLQDIQLFVKREDDQIKMYASEVVGAGILNVAGVVKIDLNE
jgi:hypothetical protein